jgi:hypothetical protein
MQEKSPDMNLQRLRRYMADEANRLCKRGGTVVHKINLDDLEEETYCILREPNGDPLERDVDLLFGSSAKRRRQ